MNVVNPSILGYNYDNNLKPKLDFLQSELAMSTANLRAKVLANPVLLGYSLDKRYRPRLDQCKRAGKELRLVLTYVSLSDPDFASMLAVHQ